MFEQLFLGFWLVLILSDSLQPALGFAKNVKNIYILLLAAILILRRRDFAPINTFYQRFLPFFIVAFISLTFTETFMTSFQKTISYLLIFMVVPNFVERIYRDNGKAFFKNLVYFFSVLLAIGISLKYLKPEIGLSHVGRLTGVFGNPNGLGIFSILCFLLFSVIEHSYPDLFSKWDRRIIFLLIITSIMFSGSRNAAVSLIIFLFTSKFYKMSPFLGFLIVLIIGFASEVIGNNYVLIIKSLGLESFFRVRTLDAAGGRYIAWNFAWERIQENFFLGKGFAFDEYIMRKNFDMLSRLGHQGGVHNSYLILWLNTGIIGLFLYLLSFISTFIQGAKNTHLAFPIMYTVMFTAMFEPWLVSSLNPFTIILLIIITIIINPKFKAEGQHEEQKLAA